MDRQDQIELVVSIASVLVMIGVMVGVGVTYGGEGGILDAEGGFVLAGTILFFVLFMTAIGYALAFVVKDDGDGNGNPT